MRTLLVFDSQPVTQRKRTPDGLLVPGLIAASDNVQKYFAGELGVKGMDAKAVLRVFRPKAEVDKSAKAWDGKPVTLEHPATMVNPKTWRAVARGEAYDTKPVELGLESNLLIRDAAAIDAVERGLKPELSCAYDFHLKLVKGVSPRGEAYDAVASDFQPNHIAITGLARGGRICRVKDSTEGDTHMRALVFDALLLGSAVPVALELEEPHATTVDGLVRGLATARDTALRERDAVVEECRAKLEAQATDHAAKLKALEDGLPARVEAEAMDRAVVLAGAAKLGIKLEAEGKDTLTLRKTVLTEAAKDPARKAVMDAMVPDLAKVDAATARLATAALFALVPTDTKKVPAKGHDSLGRALAGVKTPAVVAQAQDAAPCAKGREAMMEASANAWQKKGKDK